MAGILKKSSAQRNRVFRIHVNEKVPDKDYQGLFT